MGFPEDETQHMAEVLASNGGSVCALDDPDCTHVVSLRARFMVDCYFLYYLPYYFCPSKEGLSLLVVGFIKSTDIVVFKFTY